MDKADIISLLQTKGAVKAGVARGGKVTNPLYADFVASGHHGDMAWMEKYGEVRENPALLLDNNDRPVSIIAAAFPYPHATDSGTGGLRWARYALGRDYHDELRERLSEVGRAIGDATGAEWRVCVDTAPLRERFWAMQAGIGRMGLNGLVIVDGAGSWCLLGFIITTLPLEPDVPSTDVCLQCGRCVSACPGQALDGHGGMDARRCRSYLTIEYRGEYRGDGIPELGRRVYGCDVCQEVCPHNSDVPNLTDVFQPREEIFSLTREDILEMEQEEFSRIFKGSAIKRTKLTGLRRNAEHCGDVADGEA